MSGIKELNSTILRNIQNNLDVENKKILNQKIMDYFVDKMISIVSGNEYNA